MCVCACLLRAGGAPGPEGLCVRAAGAVRWSCGVKMMCWNHLNPLLQLQHLPAHGDQSEQRAWSRDESAHSVIFSENPGGGLRTKAMPSTPETLLLHPPSPSSPQPPGFDTLDPCVEELSPLLTAAHPTHLNASNPMDHDRKMTEGLISREVHIHPLKGCLCHLFHYSLDKLGYSHGGI